MVDEDPEMHPIERANQCSDEDFVERYLRPSPGWQTWTHPRTSQTHTLRLSSPARLGSQELEACYRMVEETSGADYRNSSVGWHERAKREEMRSAELRYILVEADDESCEEGRAGGEKGRLRAFASMMPTWENGLPVVYCYEVHVEPHLQGTGLAQLLMSFVTRTASAIPSIQKTMLTCFVANRRGRRFYEKLGFDVDESSPRDRVLRSGRVVASDYVILSKDS